MSLANQFQQLYHTIKPLRFSQVWFRLLYKFRPLRRLEAQQYSSGRHLWRWHGPEVFAPSFLGDGKVRFLNRNSHVTNASDWNNPAYEKLWLYNLHYFDDLNAVASLSRQAEQLALIKRWISENPPVKGNGWEPYPLSLRLVNWIKWYNRAEIDDSVILQSVAQQAEALSKQLEYHILGNHLFANAKALVFVGCFLQGAQADQYLQIGLKVLKREIPEQFLADGGHFELSPMYHCILLWDLLDLINLAKLTGHTALAERLESWKEYAGRAIHWLNVMKHPDGEVSFFNDSAIGIAAKPQQLIDYARSLGLRVEPIAGQKLITLTASGYSRVNMPEHTLLFDHAAVGPEYLPGHAHADTLSFEWSVGAERVFVNSGTSVYGVSAERLRQRKTAAHNTVEVDVEDSSEVWSGFRVARRAYAVLEQAEELLDSVKLSASHNGYLRLKSKIIHLRSVDVGLKQLILTDSLGGKFNSAVAHFHLHPGVKADLLDQFNVLLTLNNGKRIRCTFSAPMRLSNATWHPGFGKTVSSSKIMVQFSSAQLCTAATIL